MTDPIALVEAAYVPAVDETAWLGAVTEAAKPMFDAREGMLAFVYDASDPAWATLRAVSTLDLDPALAGSLMSPPKGDGWLIRLLRTTHVTTGLGILPGAPPEVREYFAGGLASAGLTDGRVVNSTDPSCIGVLLAAPSTSSCAWAPIEVHRWSCLASHLAAGLRIQRIRSRLASARASGSAPEAILRPDGRVEHAEAPAQSLRFRAALKRGARAVDRARGPLRRRDADEALTIWEGLVAGRWSLVDHVDSDGRRFLLAHRNDPNAPDVRGLTLRERQVLGYVAAGHSNKVIAYELGLTTSGVASHLARARRKLGLQSMAAIRELLLAASPRRD